MTRDEELVRQVAEDFRGAALESADLSMLEYAEKLTRQAPEMCDDDVATLRRAGFDDARILDIAQITSYFNFVNRMALGLGVELEDYWKPEEILPLAGPPGG